MDYAKTKVHFVITSICHFCSKKLVCLTKDIVIIPIRTTANLGMLLEFCYSTITVSNIKDWCMSLLTSKTNIFGLEK